MDIIGSLGICGEGKFIFLPKFNRNFTKKEKSILSKEKYIIVSDNFNRDLRNFPEGIETLFLKLKFNKELKNLPKSLKYLSILSSRFNNNILLKDSNLVELSLEVGSDFFEDDYKRCKIVFNKIFELPKTLKKLSIEWFDKWLPGFDNLPDGLEELKIRMTIFDDSLDYLPGNLRNLKLCGEETCCSKIVVNLDNLPKNLEKLWVVSIRLDKRLDYLPNLRELSLMNLVYFNQPLDFLPESLEYLSIIDCHPFNQNLHYLPQNLKKLVLGSLYCFNKDLDHLPGGLRELSLMGICIEKIEHLPEGLEVLGIKGGKILKIRNLPKDLGELLVEDNFFLEEIIFPLNLRKLKLGNIHLRNYLANLPEKLESLIISSSANISLDNLPMIKELKIIWGNIESVDNLPMSLKKLSLRFENFFRLDNLPGQLEELSVSFFNLKYCDKIQIKNLPNSIKRLNIIGYKGDIGYKGGGLRLPESLEYLSLDYMNCGDIILPLDINPGLKTVCFASRNIEKINDFEKKYPHIQVIKNT